ncbi:MAG TPA: antibiotic biosynthesis monooxygenase [Solirubrobacteraceae bacterium]|jgi:quinol monooxygenase YgiN|nr:antibiotic biosynthesis monooxygenase [Solirubrobacteraceae bacterium]
MDELYGLHVRFRANSGLAVELERLLLEAAAGAGDAPDCRLYVVGRSPEESDLVWVLEVWGSREAHDASLNDPDARALIQRVMPLLAERPQVTQLRPAGGKGL